ncbi:chain length determinant protein [Streptomyces sp. NBC_00201]|uniref:chain length determinant protein n=1 Tax=unclassified Streptomyces TaxID=2593676 RepID=UPI00225AB33F|nr:MULTISPECIES: chain length determinant protein [unclassified Streptomyces]MCX5063201.1 chain length determinant protein [Streptomyces sp. NBC_00452]MCX5251041.1 chain length determinant protein [Streptomyces sp. NBC_00201]MCX5291030.1 chain length determinant protein [Streptomyces sp. NBC_00183]
MDLAEIFRVMRRRWYVLLPGLLLTAGLIVGVVLLVPIGYQSQSTVVLLNSQKATVAYDGNPFLSTQTSLTGMADSLARNLNSDVSLRELKSRGATGTFEAKLADNAQGPLMWLTVTGTDKAAVLSSNKILTAYAKDRLDQFQKQQSVAPKAMIRMTTIVPPQNPVAQTKTRIEYMVMAGALGLVLSLLAVFYVEARRRPRTPAEPEEPAQRDETAQPVTAAEPPAGESVAEQTIALRRPPAWSRSNGNGRAAQPRTGRSATAVAPATEPLEEESTHGQRSHTGQ